MVLTTTEGTLRKTAAFAPLVACGVVCYGVPAHVFAAVGHPHHVLHLNLYRARAEWIMTVGVDMGKPNTLFASVAEPHRAIIGIMW